FDSFTPSTVMHTQTPNGDTGSRLDSAVLTGLARRFGSRCVGYQNRATYDTVYEDAFDCYDVYLAWGPGWREFLPDRNRYIDRVVAVGCLDNDGSPARPPTRRAQPVVSIFTSELGGSLYASHDVAELVGVCAELARRHPECSFRVKTKDPEDVDHLLADPALRERCCSRHGNFEFLRLARHDVSRVIGDSDIVIASAWTTPGADALLLEKRTIFYNPMRGGGEPFRGLPHLIASSPEELLEVFELARRDYDRYAAVNREQIVRLDPFRDGRPRDRIADELLAPGSGPPGGR
ncbi:MAG: hypothetical protein JO156_03445, partial [Solirubrobacterales bacterium]|nr:hypothetical protein [Solirubrobacterales bacterium]